MRNSRDSFLVFLNTNLPSLPIHPVRRDSNNPDADIYQVNAINVKFLSPIFDNQVSKQPVSIDIIHDDELTALDWSQQFWTLISTRFYTNILDYTIPASPVATGYMLNWDRVLKFTDVMSPYYSHLHCTMNLNGHLI